jgi:hypothetical protein
MRQYRNILNLREILKVFAVFRDEIFCFRRSDRRRGLMGRTAILRVHSTASAYPYHRNNIIYYARKPSDRDVAKFTTRLFNFREHTSSVHYYYTFITMFRLVRIIR